MWLPRHDDQSGIACGRHSSATSTAYPLWALTFAAWTRTLMVLRVNH